METMGDAVTHFYKSRDGVDRDALSLGKEGLLSFDTETTGTRPYVDELLGVAVTDNSTSSHYFLPGDPSIPKEIFLDDSIPKIAHNAVFDRSMMKRMGYTINNIYDTMVAAQLCGELDLSLKELSSNILMRKVISFGDLKVKVSDLTPEQVAQYSMPHAIAAWCLWNGFDCGVYNGKHYTWEGYDKALRRRGSAGIFHNIEMPMVPILSEMELTGAMIDEVALKSMGEEFQRKADLFEEALNFHAGKEGINWRSPDQVAWVLFDKLGLPKGPATKGGKRPTTNEQYLKKLKSRHPIINCLLEYRGYQKLISTYVEGISSRLIDGRIHTRFNLTGTRTGRLSSSDPNLQNIPKREAEGKRIRSVFCAPPGKVLIKADFSQLELRMISHYSQDPILIKTYLENGDLHLKTALEVFNDADKRFYGKTLNFSVVYGAGPELVAEQAGWTKKQAKVYLAKYFEVYFRLRTWIDMMYDLCEYEKEAWTMFGRRRPLPGFDSGEPKMIQHAKREAVSTIIQGSSSEVVKCGMIRLEKALRGSDNHLILQVHDEVVIEANEKEQDEVVHLINELLPVRRNSDDLPMGKRMSIDLPVEIEVGPNWKDTRVVEAR